MDYRTIAKRVISKESLALEHLSQNIPKDFNKLVDHIINFDGRLIFTAIGKSGYIARKISSSFASIGISSFYIHPAEASHGDLGMIRSGDLVIILSNSGETKELCNLINYCKDLAIKIAAITMNEKSNLALNSDYLLIIPTMEEASLISAPTTSTTMMLSLGDALVVAVQEIRQFSKSDFSLYHPGGQIGANLLQIKDLMHSGDRLPIIFIDTLFFDAICIMNQKALGCAIVVDHNNHIIGMITDGDLRRHMSDGLMSKCAGDVMTINPYHISKEHFASEVLIIMNDKAITSLPVTEDNKLIGIIHIHDLLKVAIE
jgi:arabinose-5-phosphate isomerase